MLKKFLNINGKPGEKIDLNCLHDELVVIRCCISKEVAKLSQKRLYGIECSNKYLQNLRFRQLLLQKLMCINYDLLEYECLSEQEIVNIINYLRTNCKECNPFNVN
ncbi:MAG: hypothetical protein KatS3mg002_1383 [Candidatus Woesearchaeota archaeon]|nr:MAG: hypothetical protein KatS3mg002_1383 [Candidatus Woesearchaeota archaeon]